MSSVKKLEDIFEELRFTAVEQKGFNEAVQVAKAYMRNGDVDIEKQFLSIVEKVAKNEI